VGLTDIIEELNCFEPTAEVRTKTCRNNKWTVKCNKINSL